MAEADDDAVPKPATDIPKTRRHDTSAQPADDAPARPSATSLDKPLTFPDDGPLARRLRQIDHFVGLFEQGALVAAIASIVLTSVLVALADKLFGIHHPSLLGFEIGDHKDEILRLSTFAIAMFGAAFASHQQRHLAMDLVSRRLSPRGRLVLRVLLAMAVTVLVALLVRSGQHLRERELAAVAEQGGSSRLIETGTIAGLIPLGGALVIFHTLVHAVIDVDYLVRGKLPPERARSGH